MRVDNVDTPDTLVSGEQDMITTYRGYHAGIVRAGVHHRKWSLLLLEGHAFSDVGQLGGAPGTQTHGQHDEE